MPAVWRVVLLVVLCAGLSEGAAYAQDEDYDGIPDALEAELAARFVPTLRPPRSRRMLFGWSPGRPESRVASTADLSRAVSHEERQLVPGRHRNHF